MEIQQVILTPCKSKQDLFAILCIIIAEMLDMICKNKAEFFTVLIVNYHTQ